MSVDLRIVRANSWLRSVQDVGGDIIIVTAAHVAEAMQFPATIQRSDGSVTPIPHLRAKYATPLRVDIPARPGRTFAYDETVHDLTNLAEIGVFHEMHHAAHGQLLFNTDHLPCHVFNAVDGGGTTP